jgi:stage II sporulation protein R
MKKFCISFLVFLIIILSVVGVCLPSQTVNTEYLRIHVRADSNEQNAQQVKYIVKDAVVEYLTPIIANITTKQMAKERLQKETANIKVVCDKVLKEQGYDYQSKVSLKSEEFPTRTYDNFTLEQGIYDALIIELGSGKGDNWWCVVYPPLCFVEEGKTSYIYKSKIYEIIKDFVNKRGG